VISYQQSKLWSRHPEEYGHGSIEGVAANEAAQNASQAGEMVPTFDWAFRQRLNGDGLGSLLMHVSSGAHDDQRGAAAPLRCGRRIDGWNCLDGAARWPMSLYMLKLMSSTGS